MSSYTHTRTHIPGVFYPEAQLPQHLDGGHLAVQCVHVEAGHLAAVQQRAAHLHGMLDAVVADGRVVVLDGLDDARHLLRHLQLGQLHQLPQRLVALGWNSLFKTCWLFSVHESQLFHFGHLKCLVPRLVVLKTCLPHTLFTLHFHLLVAKIQDADNQIPNSRLQSDPQTNGSCHAD